jgi:Short C-terminal domain
LKRIFGSIAILNRGGVRPHLLEGVIMVRRILRTMGRTALIAGTATAVSGRVARRQNRELESAHAAKTHSQTPARRTAGAGNDITARLERLAELKSAGALTEKEFKAAKAKLLS